MSDGNAAWHKLSAETAQVLFCDLQRDLIAHSKTISRGALSSAAGALLQLARLFELPTIISVVPEGKKAPTLILELQEGAGLAPPMLRTTVSLFDDEPTEKAIAGADRKVLIVAGFMMEAVVLDTVLDGRLKGYDVIVAIDACGSPSARTEQAAIRQMEAAGAITSSVVSIGTRLAPDLSKEQGQRMFAIVQGIQAA